MIRFVSQHPHTSYILTLIWLTVHSSMADLSSTVRRQDYLQASWLVPITWTSHYQSCLEARDLPWPHHKQKNVAQPVQPLPGEWSFGLGVVPHTSVATLIIPACLLRWVTEVQHSTNATACRGCCLLCRLYPFISGDSRVVLSLLMPVRLLMGCAELHFSLSSARLCLSLDNRHDLAN